MDTQKINLHTHTSFCDGNNSPEEMILSAIQRGFSVIGFSGHSMYPFARSWHIAPRDFDSYVKCIRELEQKYKDKIRVLLGFEADYFPGICTPERKNYERFNPDFIIGSVHYVANQKGHYSVDNSVEKVQHNLIRLYGKEGCGMESVDGKKAVCEYFEAQRQMLKLGNFELWGHPDVIRKRNGILHFFDENESWYKEELKLTVKEAARAGVCAEINTGAIARGAMDDFYPSAYFLQLIHDAGIPVCINSDAHNAKDLDCAFDRAREFAKKAGYKELTYPFCGTTYTVSI